MAHSSGKATGAARRRLVWSVALATGVVVAATVTIPSYGTSGRSESNLLAKRYDRTVAARTAARAEARPHTHANGDPLLGLDGHTHSHDDPATKNAVSRTTGTSVTAETRDPTTPAEARAAVAAVKAQRDEADPELVPLAKQPHRRAVPQDRYAMASGCYVMRATTQDRFVRRSGDGFAATLEHRKRAEPFHFQATTLGKYLLYADAKDFLAEAGVEDVRTGTVESADAPSDRAVWTVSRTKTRNGPAYLFRSGGRGLAVGEDGVLTMADRPAPFALRTTKGCAKWPEVETNVEGRPFKGASPFQEVRGYLDAHTHGMAFEFLGGGVHCGKPWDPFGVTVALMDCPDHYLADGKGAALEDVLNSGTPGTGHDPVGWPTFKDWPAPHSLTHEGTYYKWMERSWRGGLRLFTNLLVENGKLCQIYPIKGEVFAKTQCDDMKSIRLQAKDMHRLERYVDAQYGGPGKGWYRIVTNPFQARKVINEGKLAVIMGIETSVLFGCTMKLDIPDPSCTKASITKQLNQVHKMGVRQMELVNKFDNALSGVAGDEGSTGVAVNSANFLETGSFWRMQTCPTSYKEGVHDKEQLTGPGAEDAFTQRDAIFGAIFDMFGGTAVPAAPAYAPAPHCNELGLSDLGAHTIRSMVKKGMIFDPDHMSVSGRKASLSILEKLDYPGVVSSHSWATPDAYPRIYKLGGVVTPYAGDSTGFVDKWRRHLTWADPRYYFGFGYGADMNGLGAQGNPRGTDVANPVTYPFKGLGGVTVRKQHSGKRVYDINADGVAHYGLYPDWIEDLRKVAGSDGADIVDDMARGPEAYLQMWERAVGVSNDACRDPRALKAASVIRGLPEGASPEYVLKHAGQPHSRLGRTFTYCAKAGAGTAKVKVLFTGSGHLVRTT